VKDAAQGSPQADAEIEISGLSKTFGQGAATFEALKDVSLTIRRGEFFTLLGPSGCGKTTLLRMIAGFEHPTRGTLRIGGREMGGLGPNQRSVNTVFQNYALFPHMTVADNIGFGLRMLGKARAEVKATVADMLRLVRMEQLADRRPSEISGGQQQRVALARALAPRPGVLLLDEPLSALDLKLRKEMQSELKRLQTETGITFVFVTHDQEEALTMSDRVAVMNAGRILQIGSPREIYDHPAERFVADFIGDTNFLTAKVTEILDQGCRVRLPSGVETSAGLPNGMRPSRGDEVTVVIRPEHARIADDGALWGQIEHSTFFGTDTHITLTLDGGENFTVRRQNAADLPPPPMPGERVAISVAEGGTQVLRA
jgi:spermidine/putrescine transport system ATP-binding protein